MADDVECQPCVDPPPTAAAAASASGATTKMEDMPTVAIVIGMAGSGKTSLMQRINAYRHAKGKPPYIINLDPAWGGGGGSNFQFQSISHAQKTLYYTFAHKNEDDD